MTLRVSPEVKTGLEYLSSVSNRSRAYLAEQAIGEYVRQNAWQSKILQERLAEADKGEFVSHEVVGKWLKKRIKTGKWGVTPKPDVFLKK